MSRTRTAARLALGAGLGMLALAQPAPAATLGVGQEGGSTVLRYSATGGEANALRVTTAPDGRLLFKDDGAVIHTAGSACVRLSDHEASCRSDAAPSLHIGLADLDDRVVNDTSRPARLAGDAGHDQLIGGAGNESLWGSAGDDVLDGRGGADLLSGEAGTDTARYADRSAAVTVDLNFGGLGTEGEAGERDTVASDVERVVGGSGNDSLTGNGAPNLLEGGGGDDVLVGGGGADEINGGGGTDTLRARDGAVDRVNCGGDPDAVEADGVDQVTECESTAPPAAPGTNPPSGGGVLTLPFTFTFGSFELPTKPVVLRGAHVTLTVTCPESMPGGRCTGVVSLERTVKAKPHRNDHHHHAVASRHQRSRARIGERSYAVRAGRRTALRVRVSRVERRRLARSTGSTRVKVYLRRTKRAHRATRVGTLKVRASRRTKRRSGRP